MEDEITVYLTIKLPGNQWSTPFVSRIKAKRSDFSFQFLVEQSSAFLNNRKITLDNSALSDYRVLANDSIAEFDIDEQYFSEMQDKERLQITFGRNEFDISSSSANGTAPTSPISFTQSGMLPSGDRSSLASQSGETPLNDDHSSLSSPSNGDIPTIWLTYEFSENQVRFLFEDFLICNCFS